VHGIISLPFELGVTRYDSPPPDHLVDLEGMAAQGAFRFANQLTAYVDFENGKPVAWGHLGNGFIAGSEVHFGPAHLKFTPVMYPILRPDPVASEDAVTFTQTVGGRTSLPSPRRIARSARVRLDAPPVWTTLSLTIQSDGTCRHGLAGASAIPRHWVYDENGRLAQKSAVMDFTEWYGSPEEDTPWGGPDSSILVVEVESDLEHRLSRLIMDEPKVKRRSLAKGDTLVRQGDLGTDIFLLLDGVLVVEVDGSEVAEVGPGAIIGEMASLGSGARSATLRAATNVRVAVIPSASLNLADLETISHDRQPGAGGPGIGQ
jgi:hypothetical protein